MAAASLGAFGASGTPKGGPTVGAIDAGVQRPNNSQLPKALLERLANAGPVDDGAWDMRPAGSAPVPVGQIGLSGTLTGDDMIVTGRFTTRDGSSCRMVYAVDAQNTEVSLLGGEGCLPPGQQEPDVDLAEVGGAQLDGTYVLAGTVDSQANHLQVSINGAIQTFALTGPLDATNSTRRVFMATVSGRMSDIKLIR